MRERVGRRERGKEREREEYVDFDALSLSPIASAAGIITTPGCALAYL